MYTLFKVRIINLPRVTVTPSKEWFKISESFASHTLKLLQLPGKLVLAKLASRSQGNNTELLTKIANVVTGNFIVGLTLFTKLERSHPEH